MSHERFVLVEEIILCIVPGHHFLYLMGGVYVLLWWLM